MPSELVKKVRAAYPDAYVDMSDAELERAVLAKYPQYVDLAEKTLSGFASNALESGGRFLKDTALGAVGLLKGANRVGRAVFNPAEAQKLAADVQTAVPAVISHLGQSLRNRYGSVENIEDTLYNDPVGVLADVSTLASGVGGAAKITGRVPGVVSKAAMVERVTNPLTPVGMIAKPLARVASDAVIDQTVRPSKALRDDFGGRRGIADAIRQERVTTADAASNALRDSLQRTDDIITRAASQQPGVPVRPVADTLIDTSDRAMPMSMAQRRKTLGIAGNSAADLRTRYNDMLQHATDAPYTPPALQEQLNKAKRIASQIVNNPQRAAKIAAKIDELEKRLTYPLPHAQELKREAQRIGYGSDAADVSRRADKTLADALQRGIEQRVPAVKASNQRTRRLLAAEKALAAAEDRPAGIFVPTVATGIGATLGSIPGAGLGAIIGALRDSPRVGTLTGIGINDIGRLLANPAFQRGALVSRATGEPLSPREIDMLQELIRRQLASTVASH